MIVNPNAIRVKPWSMARRETFLKSQAERAKHMIIGVMGQELSQALTQTKEQLDESRTYFAELCAAADSGDRVAQQEMQEIRIWSVQNFLVAGLNYGSFFEVLNLEKGDVPYIENTTRQEAMVSFVGQDGGEVRWQAFVNWTNTQIPAFWLTSNDFEYPLVDEYTGEVADRSKSNVDIAFDLNMKLDAILFSYLQALIGVFNNAGDPATRVFVAHTRINQANLPTTNLLVPGDTGEDTLFRKSCMDAILAYCKAWGDQAFEDGPLRPVAVYVPSAHITGFLDEVEVSNPVNEYAAQIWEFGMVMNYAGSRWAFIADPTLDPGAGLAYVKFNKSIGKLYTKTGLDKMIVDNGVAMQKQNMESVSERKVFFAAIPNQARINICAVQYRTPAALTAARTVQDSFNPGGAPAQ